MSRRGFTLLEVVVALAILGVSLMAIFDINAQAVAKHVYAKKLTVATLLARSKMIDLEQELYDQGLDRRRRGRLGRLRRRGLALVQVAREDHRAQDERSRPSSSSARSSTCPWATARTGRGASARRPVRHARPSRARPPAARASASQPTRQDPGADA